MCCAFVATKEPEQHLGVFSNVVMHVEEHRRRRLELSQRSRRDRDEVADTTDFDEHPTVVEALEHRTPQRPDHVATARAIASMCRRKGAEAR